MQCQNEGGIYGLSIHVKCLPYQDFRLSATVSSCSRDKRHLDNEQFSRKSTCKCYPPGWQRECYARYKALCAEYFGTSIYQILWACCSLTHYMDAEDANTQDCCYFSWQYACHPETTLEFLHPIKQLDLAPLSSPSCPTYLPAAPLS